MEIVTKLKTSVREVRLLDDLAAADAKLMADVDYIAMVGGIDLGEDEPDGDGETEADEQ